MPLRLDAHPKRVRRPNISGRAPCERDCPLLLGESISEFGGRCDLCLKFGPTLRRKRSVRERSKLGDLLIADLVSATTSYGHGATYGSSWPGARQRSKGAEETVLLMPFPLIDHAQRRPFAVVSPCY
jgi:hypothetical protein